MAHLEDVIGKKIRHFTIESFEGWRGSKQMWRCRCVCGNVSVLDRDNLNRGKPASCGCAGNPNTETFKKAALERALSLIDKTEDCWIWKGLERKEKGFYPYFNYNHCQYHPVKFFKLLIDEIVPKGWTMYKTCTTLKCVNPDHYTLRSISSIRYQNKKEGEHERN